MKFELRLMAEILRLTVNDLFRKIAVCIIVLHDGLQKILIHSNPGKIYWFNRISNRSIPDYLKKQTGTLHTYPSRRYIQFGL